MTDILDQAREHNWWYSDQNHARLLMDEVVALRRTVELGDKQIIDLLANIAKLTAEIERLRAEATQLRQAIGLLTTLHPTMEINVNNPVQMALEIVSYVTESRDAEIERLRGDINYLESQNSKTIHRAATEIEQLRGLVDACAIYLKEDETPAQRIERERADTDAVLKILLKEKREVERLRELVYAVPPTEHATGQTWKEACEANRTEVARLDNLLRTYRLPDEVVDIKVVIELRAEIERLRGLLGDVQIIMDSHNNIVGNLNGEIERLRKELAEKDDYIRTISRPIGAHSYE